VRRASGIFAGGAAALTIAIVVAGCGPKDENRFGTFTDCSKIGPVATVTDPAGDQRGRLAGKPPQPQGDLVRLRVARREGKLCVEFQAAADVKPPVAYVLVMRPQHAETPVAQLEATVLSGADPEVLLQARPGDAFRTLDGKVGILGDRVSVLVDRAPFAAQSIGPLFDAFRYQGRSAAVTTDGGRQTDCVPVCR
jgi:hypothetical protein